ncbi:MAG: lysine 2,3-aminomutase [Enhygromyxa sp.]
MQSPASDVHEQLRYRSITRSNIQKLPEWDWLSKDQQEAIEVVSAVLPFKTNRYVLRELIDWRRVPDDPIFQLTFVQRDMLEAGDYARIAGLLARGADKAELRAASDAIRRRLNPHPAGQTTHNVPTLDGRKLPGMQHKYRETVLFFPGQGQTCHAYCTFCFRWAQFVGLDEMKFEARETDDLTAYLRAHPEVTDVLVTGGDPMVMKASALRRYLEPLLAPEFERINIRIGTKSVAYWPHRYVSDPDADEILRLFEQITQSGRHLAIMGHYNHPRELETETARRAVARIRSTGAVIRMQSPLIRNINDNPEAWAELWRVGVKLGCVPYYMFVERDTGPKNYFEVPLVRAWEIFRSAYQQVSGLARSVRGPSMSAFPGKILVDGVAEIAGEKVFALQLLQARDPEWVRRPFYAKFDPQATWFDQLEPAFGEREFFFDSALREDEQRRSSSVHLDVVH